MKLVKWDESCFVLLESCSASILYAALSGWVRENCLKKYTYIFHSFIRVQFVDHSQSVQATAAKMGTTKTAKRTQHPTSWFWIISL